MLEGLQFTVIENVKKASPFMRTALKHIILSQFLTKGKVMTTEELLKLTVETLDRKRVWI